MCGPPLMHETRLRYHGYLRPLSLFQDQQFARSEWTASGDIRLEHGLVIPCCLDLLRCSYAECQKQTTGREFFYLYPGGPVFWVAVGCCVEHCLKLSPPVGADRAFVDALAPKDWKVHHSRWVEASSKRKKPARKAEVAQAEVQSLVARPKPDDLEARMAELLDASDNLV